jgi:hypothetical protein
VAMAAILPEVSDSIGREDAVHGANSSAGSAGATLPPGILTSSTK